VGFDPNDLKVKLFADGANLSGMLEMYEKTYVKGLTTNPSLMRKAGIIDYKSFAREVLQFVTNKPISFEVLSDDFDEMIRQAEEIASWADNTYVKIPITNTKGVSTFPVVKHLSGLGCKLNITAILTEEQVRLISQALNPSISSFVSIFAGRIADTGRDPEIVISKSISYLSHLPYVEIIWASPRELLNIFQAENLGCHIITATNDLLHKLNLIGKDLTEYSLETVRMFKNDADESQYSL
jgi:transaldolase